jgi:hypothetical protein
VIRHAQFIWTCQPQIQWLGVAFFSTHQSKVFFSYQNTLKIRHLTPAQQQKLMASQYAMHDLDKVCGMETPSS